MDVKATMRWIWGLLLCAAGTACKPEAPLQERIEASGYPDATGGIFLTTCATEDCHAGPSPEAGLSLESWEQLMAGSARGAVLVPYETDWSFLFQHVNTYPDLGLRALPTMPEDSSEFLSRAEVLRLRDWISAGALSRSGAYYWAQRKQETGQKVFALCSGSDLVAVSDLGSDRIMRFVEVGQLPGELEAPHYIAVSPDRQHFYVTLINGNLLEKYRTDTYAFAGRVAIGASPSLIALSPDGSRAVVTHWNDSENEAKLSLIDTETMTLVQEIRAGGSFMSYPHGLAANADFSVIYVTANQGNYISRLELDADGFLSEEKWVLDPANDPLERPTNAYLPYQVLLSPDGQRLYISCSARDEVRVLHAQTGALLAVIPVGDYPRLMALDPAGGRLFVACRSQENAAEQGAVQGCVSVIDLAELRFLRNLYNVGHRPHGVSVAPGGRLLYISSENTGGTDIPHHPTAGSASPPGKYNVVDLQTLQVLKDRERDLAEIPNALIVVE